MCQPELSKLVFVAGNGDSAAELVYLASCGSVQLPRTNFLLYNLLI